MDSPAKAEPASPEPRHDAHEELHGFGEDEKATEAPSHALLTDLVEDDGCSFQVAVGGVRRQAHLARREALLNSMAEEVTATMPSAAVAWTRAIEDKLIEEIETLKDDLLVALTEVHRLTTVEAQLRTSHQCREAESRKARDQLQGELDVAHRQLRMANAQIASLGRRIQSATASTSPTPPARSKVGNPTPSAAPPPPLSTVRVAPSAAPFVPMPMPWPSQAPSSASDQRDRDVSGTPLVLQPRFTIKPAGLPTFDGAKQDLEAARTFINSLQRYFEATSFELGCVGTDGWSTAAMLQLREAASRWADDNFPPGMRPDWTTFTTAFIKKFTPADAIGKLKLEWETLSLKRTERAAAFNDRFRELRARLDPYAPLPADRLLDAYAAKIQVNKEVAAIYRMLASMHPPWTLEEYMDQVADSDSIQNGSHSKGTGSIALTRSSLKRMEVTGKAGLGARRGETECFRCGEKGHIARSCTAKVNLSDMRIRNVFNVSRLTADRTNEERIYITPPSPVRTSRAGTSYVIEAIVGHRPNEDKEGTWEYEVKWEGWDAKDNTWETEANLARAKAMLREYWAKQGGRPRAARKKAPRKRTS
jgi:hypothetical protein